MFLVLPLRWALLLVRFPYSKFNPQGGQNTGTNWTSQTHCPGNVCLRKGSQWGQDAKDEGCCSLCRWFLLMGQRVDSHCYPALLPAGCYGWKPLPAWDRGYSIEVIMSPCVLVVPCSRVLVSVPALRSPWPALGLCCLGVTLDLDFNRTSAGSVLVMDLWNNGRQREGLLSSLNLRSLNAICLLESPRTRSVCLCKRFTCSCRSLQVPLILSTFSRVEFEERDSSSSSKDLDSRSVS